MKKLLITLCIFFCLLLILLNRNVILGALTKDFKKQIFVHETDRYKIELYNNLSMGCPQSNVERKNDTLKVSNYSLKDLLSNISQKFINNSRYIGFDEQVLKERYDLIYYPKDTNSVWPRNEILDHLGKALKFSFNYDTVNQLTYEPRIINDKRLQFISPNENSRFTMNKNHIEINGINLEDIFRFFSYSIEGLMVEGTIADSSYYEFSIPSTDKNEIISYLNSELGIKLNGVNSQVEVINFRYNE